MPPPILLLADLATATGRSEDWWRRHWRRMHEAHHFPRKLPGLWGWPRPAVEAWLAAGGGGGGEAADGATPANDNRAEGDLDTATRLLEARFGILRDVGV